MHELGLMERIVALIVRDATPRGIRRVTDVSVALGAVSHVTPEAARSAFEIVSAGTICQGARLHAKPEPLEGWCPRCRATRRPDPGDLSCPRCGGAVEVPEGASGIRLLSYEGEGPEEG